MVYGSYGYTGDLIVRRAIMRGYRPVVAGRRGSELNSQADDLGLPAKVFDLSEHDRVVANLDGIDVVVNCAGPFVDTYEPLVEACLDAGVDYLDITGEIDVFEGLSALDGRARDAGVGLLPGVGYDVVPTDSLAVHLVERLPSATGLELGIDGVRRVSRGTARTALRTMDGAWIREDGKLRRVPLGRRRATFDFGEGQRTATAIPYGDVVTAYHSTGVENIAVYLTVPPGVGPLLGVGGPFLSTVARSPVGDVLDSLVASTFRGPDERHRRESTTTVVGRATDGERTVSTRLRTPGPYEFTVLSTLAILERVRDGDLPAGYSTPAGAFGPDLVTGIDGVTRTDLD